jgi:HK97 family phage major capsid protein
MNHLISNLRERRAALKAESEQLLNRAEVAGRGSTPAETRTIDDNLAQIRDIDARLEELSAASDREGAATAHRATTTLPGGSHYSPARTRSRDVYAADRTDVSFFRDLVNSRQGDLSAAQRLQANNDAVRETRAGDMTSIAGTGGEFAPPLWAVEDFAALARPHRVTANILRNETLPRGISSINIPAVATGSGAGVQVTQNSALTDTAMTTTSVSSGITLIGGKQIVSRQLIDQSGIPFDRVILGDLAADYAKQLDVQVINGTGANSQLNGLHTAAGNTVTYTSGSPVVVSATNTASFYFQLVSAVTKVSSNRYLPPTAIVMHPRRWGWILNALDTQTRPLLTPSTATFNGLGASGMPSAEGMVGDILGVPVYVDPNVSTTANSTTNQDEVFVLRTDDSWLYESELEGASFEAPVADQASVLFRVLGYSGLVHRYSKSITRIVGTGLVDPGIG